MIAQVNTKPRRMRYLAACAGSPVLGCLLSVHLELFGKNGNFYAGPTLALDVNGSGTLAAGHANPEELASFLGFLGKHRILTDGTAPAGWHTHRVFHVFTLECGKRLPQPPLCAAPSLVLDEDPKPGAVADFLFDAGSARRDGFYSEQCTKRAHGKARVWALEDKEGRIVCTVGAYALHGGEAYMACGETAEALRGQGIGGHLIVKMANTLAAQGHTVRFLCHDERVHFYTRLGFAQTGTLTEYTDASEDETR